jgi:glutamine amidotransferase
MITVIDNDLGNIGSVVRALNFLNIDYHLTRDLNEIEKASKLIFPGVGSYKAAAEKILSKDFKDLVRFMVLEKQVPIFGFCLGMQLLTDSGEEMGHSQGLGLIRASTKFLRVDTKTHSVPHMGWNDVSANGLKMFSQVPEYSCFYFVHSYEVMVDDSEVKVATVNYGGVDVCAAVEKGHIWGAQFHPEKSQRVGLQLIKNFNVL